MRIATPLVRSVVGRLQAVTGRASRDASDTTRKTGTSLHDAARKTTAADWAAGLLTGGGVGILLAQVVPLVSAIGDNTNETDDSSPGVHLEDEVLKLAALSPTLDAQLRALVADGWSIHYASTQAGVDGYSDIANKRIVISDKYRSDPATALRSLTLEVGHVLDRDGAPYVAPPPPTPGMTGREWVEDRLDREFKAEAESELFTADIVAEIHGNGGPTLANAEAFHPELSAVHEKLTKGDISRQEATDALANEPAFTAGWHDHYEQKLIDTWNQQYAESHGPYEPPTLSREELKKVIDELKEKPDEATSNTYSGSAGGERP